MVIAMRLNVKKPIVKNNITLTQQIKGEINAFISPFLYSKYRELKIIDHQKSVYCWHLTIEHRLLHPI